MAITTANVTTTIGNVYTSSGNSAVTFLSMCNTGNASVTANVHIVPSGSSADVSNMHVIGLEITANGANTGDTYQVYSGGEKLLLGNGDTIQMVSSANTVTAITSYTSI
jgi:hypothetical protein